MSYESRMLERLEMPTRTMMAVPCFARVENMAESSKNSVPAKKLSMKLLTNFS
jgi:hypothetical protein